MQSAERITVDANEAVAAIAHRLSEVIAIYPITPASTMGELADAWSAEGRRNLWGMVPEVVEMQSEGGAAGAVHGALAVGALATTFTASQGLLLMLPNMYKIAGELTPFVLHVAARTIATHALSIFGDHSDVMAARPTGFAMLAAGSVQEAQDFAAVAHAATLEARIPFLHFFDGFRTSHEVAKIDALAEVDLAALIDERAIAAHRARALDPERPVLRGTAQNPDAFFQGREAANPYYAACPAVVERVFARFADRTGRAYRLFEYHGHPQAERVIVAMGSGAEAAHETVDWMIERGERVGVLKVRLYRPFAVERFLAELPGTTRRIAVLDRTKEPGSPGEPLYLDVVAALAEGATAQFASPPQVVGGRFGLSSKEFTPAMVRAVFAELEAPRPRNRFTIGIVDDVSHGSLAFDPDFDLEPDDVRRAVFFGLGSDGTVGANKNSIKILGEETDFFAQGYFVYDSKKSGAVTVSHLRFGPRPIRSSYLVRRAHFVACHQPEFLDRFEMAELALPGGTLLLNTPRPAAEVWASLPREVQEQAIAKGLRLFAIDAAAVARAAGLGGRINTIMQTCFFALSGVLPAAEAIAHIKAAVASSYAKRGAAVVAQNEAAIDAALAALVEIPVPPSADATRSRPPIVPANAPDFVSRVTAVLMAGKGDLLPVSAFPVDGTWPTGTAVWEKRGLAAEIPIWDADLCIQCNQCAFVCPHAAIRAKVWEGGGGSAVDLHSRPYKAADLRGLEYTLQVAPDDCTGCGLCVAVCPAKERSNPRHKAIEMRPRAEHLDIERANYGRFLALPEVDRTRVARLDAKGSQLLQPLFESSGACAGCGETPYLKLLTQLFGDRLLIANATGCSSIYGANLPTTPYSKNPEGRGPAWSNSLFEDNAEFGFGFRLALDARERRAKHLLARLADRLPEALVSSLLTAEQLSEAGVAAQRARVAELLAALARDPAREAADLAAFADALVRKSLWIVGGDGWAYDIGFGGLDHVLAQHRDVNVLVLDTEVYSNTGGQQSKATPLGAAAKFASAGKEIGKKDLGLLAMSYGHVYVARVAFGAKINQTVEAIREAESYPGPSLVIAYSHCIAHGYDLVHGAAQQDLAAKSGLWPLYRFDPRRVAQGEPPLHLDAAPASVPVADFMRNEARFRMVEKRDPDRFRRLMAQAQREVTRRVALYEQLSHLTVPRDERAPEGAGRG
ncbi:MAG: pyruvate:ferredoxin (flavodoxin) oxidoreductase [Thermoanaerobaculia bacterium]